MLTKTRKESQRRNRSPGWNRNYFDPENGRVKFHINITRNSIVKDTIKSFSRQTETRLKGSLKVNFSGEHGVDAGGLTRECFFLIFSKWLSKDYEMFEVFSDRFYWF
jgi:hypothetical protein